MTRKLVVLRGVWKNIEKQCDAIVSCQIKVAFKLSTSAIMNKWMAKSLKDHVGRMLQVFVCSTDLMYDFISHSICCVKMSQKTVEIEVISLITLKSYSNLIIILCNKTIFSHFALFTKTVTTWQFLIFICSRNRVKSVISRCNLTLFKPRNETLASVMISLTVSFHWSFPRFH